MTDVGRKLDALGAQLAYPPTPDLAARVVERVDERRRRRAFRLRVLVVGAAVTLASAGALLAASPSARSAVARWLEVAGVRIERRDELPEIPTRGAPYYGTRTTIARAQEEVSFSVLVPPELGRPDAVFFQLYPPGGSVSLLYGTPRRPTLVLTQYAGRSVEPVSLKVAGPDTRVELLTVGGGPAVWLEGAPHLVYTIVGDGEYPQELYLAGNVLIWERGRRAFRLEADVDRERAVEIAESLP